MNQVFSPKGKIASVAIATLLVSVSIAPALAEIRASVSQRQVVEGEPFQLSIQVEGASGNAQPDLAPLAKDFTVGATGQSSQTSIINGRTTMSHGWTVTLSPKSTGAVEIPAIRVGNETSTPIAIDVVDAASLPKTSLAQSGLEIEMSAAPGPYYVHQEIPVTVRITDAGGLRSAQLSDLSGPDLIVAQRGEDRVSQTMTNGRPVNVIERDYMVKPQKSGSFTLGPLRLQGSVKDPNGRRSPFGDDFGFSRMRQQFGFSGFGDSMFDNFFTPTKTVTARSNALTIDVASNPAGQSQWFLPARAVDLKQSWQPENPQFKVGEAASRVVQIVALGASKEQLPDIAFADVDGASIYVDRVDDRSTDTAQGTAAIKQYSLSVVPTRGGSVTLPEISVEWFDTAAGEQKTAILPAQTIEVAGGTAAAAAPAPAAPSTNATSAGNGPSASPGNDLAAIVRQADWRTAGGAGAAVLLLAGLLTAMIRRHRNAANAAAAATASGSAAMKVQSVRNAAESVTGKREKRIAETARAVRAACRRNNGSDAYHQFGLWSLAAGYDVATDRSAEADALKAQLGALETRLFGGKATKPWKGGDLLAAFDAVVARQPHARHGAGAKRAVAPLYPTSNNMVVV